MSVCRSKLPLMAVVSLLVMLLTSTIVVSQTPRISTGIPVNDPPKAEGAIRVGLVTPRVSLIGGGGMVTQETISLRQNVSSYLTGPRIGTVDLKAKLDSLALEEAKERQCDYVLYTSLIRKRQPTATGAGGNYGGGTRAGDEFTFEYRVVATDGMQPVGGDVIRTKVNSDGEDVLTQMIETAAQTVVNLARGAKPVPLATTAPTPNTENVVTPERPTPVTTSTASPATGYGSLTASVPRTGTARGVSDPPKAEGTIRIGIVTPRMSLIGGGMRGNNEAASLRQTMSNYLLGSTIETIDLKARLDSLALTEGQKRECDYVLYTSLIRKRKSNTGGGGPLNSIVGSMSSGVGAKIPGGKTAKEVGSGAASVSGTIAALARTNDEVTFEYKLLAIDGARSVAAKVAKAKVKADGEDVLTPMIETAAQAIVDATRKN